MQKAIIGKKIGMTQIFDEKGIMIPVTVVEAGPCVVTAKKTVENDGYASVQLGYGDVKPHKVNKPMKGFFDKAGVAPKKTLKEFRFTDTDAYSIGDLVKADVFTPGDKIDVTGKSKGKGTAGVIKRWNFHRLKKHTVQVLAYATAVQSVPAHHLQEFGRVREWQVTSAQNR